MKPIYERLVGCPDEGFIVKEVHGDACNCLWHCHAEIELILTLRSQGYRIVGDSIQSLTPGDLVLLGANLPHAYQHTDRLSDHPQPAHCVLLQFDERLWSHFFELPAMSSAGRLLRRAANGLHVTGAARQKVAVTLQEMLVLRGLRRITAFLTILDILGQSRSCKPIASPGFTSVLNPHDQERISIICQFIDENYHRLLRIGEVAKLAHMSEGAFSRFFHSHIGKTFPAFLNDLRVGRACRLLAETDMSITEIALSCGYRNISNFNRQFLDLRQISPSEFRCRMRSPR
jgi:AraC-like DNA-binding protein